MTRRDRNLAHISATFRKSSPTFINKVPTCTYPFERAKQFHPSGCAIKGGFDWEGRPVRSFQPNVGGHFQLSSGPTVAAHRAVILEVEVDMSCTKVAIAGVSSEVGKTTLLCDLLRELPGWEAIKMTRGHYRSCGKDPHACCVSHLLGDEPLIRSGFQQTYASDKDTGRYWDAGAANVHWVIVTDSQVERGIQLALERVNAPGVLIEGNSFLRFIDVDFAVLVARVDPAKSTAKIKGSTRWAFEKASALYVFAENDGINHSSEPIRQLQTRFTLLGLKQKTIAYAPGDFPNLVTHVNRIHSTRTGASENQLSKGGHL